jgi:hypothetical protein
MRRGGSLLEPGQARCGNAVERDTLGRRRVSVATRLATPGCIAATDRRVDAGEVEGIIVLQGCAGPVW